MKPSVARQSTILRKFRKIHRILGISLFGIFVLVAVSGILLGIKKHSNEVLMPHTYDGSSTNVRAWKELYTLEKMAAGALAEFIFPASVPALDRIDVRPDKGIAKFIFGRQLEVQIDGATGEVLHIGKRHADWIEDLHDGSLFDDWLKTKEEPIKVGYTLVSGLALLGFCFTGIWLWYGPKYLKKSKRL